MVLPQVVGFKLTGRLPQTATATDLVLTCTEMLRKRGVVGKFVEFFGEGVQSLNLADRATIANMAPEYGATMGYFPIDEQTLEYLRLTGRDASTVERVEKYLREQGMFRLYDGSQKDPTYSGEVMHLDLGSVQPSLAGPKRPQDRVAIADLKNEFTTGLTQQVSFKGFGIQQQEATKRSSLSFEGKDYDFGHGSVVIAAITSCTNTSNPDVMLAAGQLAKNAVERGLEIRPYIKTSLSPGSGVVTQYYEKTGLQQYLDQLGFTTAGYGCMTCIGNSGEIPKEVEDHIVSNDYVASAVLSGNRNFEGRVHPNTRANYLASPPLVVAYALAGRVDIDWETEPLGTGKDGKPVYLREIWPSRDEISSLTRGTLSPDQFVDNYNTILKGSARWQGLEAGSGSIYEWDESSTYIHNPPFFQSTEDQPQPIPDIKDAYCLLNVGDSVTTDHISPAGKIANNSPAAKYLGAKGVSAKDFNTYGSRRGNDEIMARGTFANVRLINKMVEKVGPTTIHVPSGDELAVFEAAERYQNDGHQQIVLAGKEYGTGSSRDWAAKGPKLQGVNAVIAESFERIHRSNLVGMGILPLQFKDGQNADSLGLTGKERFSLNLSGGDLSVNQELEVTTDGGKKFTAVIRLDTDPEIEYFKNGGILQYVLRKLKN